MGDGTVKLVGLSLAQQAYVFLRQGFTGGFLLFPSRFLQLFLVRNPLFSTLYFRELHHVRVRHDSGAIAIRVYLGELGAKEQDLRRVIDPDEQYR